MSEHHTPEPWTVRESIHGPRYAVVQMGDDENYTTLELEPADARLIAAAPKMLDALRSYLKAQRAMLEKWAEVSDEKKNELWQALHACEEAGAAVIDMATAQAVWTAEQIAEVDRLAAELQARFSRAEGGAR